MSQTRKIKRKSGLSQREQERLAVKKKERNESFATRLSKVAIMLVFFVMVVSLLYTIILLS